MSTKNHQPANGRITLVIHGGAGTIRKETPPEREEAYHEALKPALRAGYSVLQSGGMSSDAVVAAISIMGDSPL